LGLVLCLVGGVLSNAATTALRYGKAAQMTHSGADDDFKPSSITGPLILPQTVAGEANSVDASDRSAVMGRENVEEYQDNCRRRNVPVPPALNTPNAWSAPIDLSTEAHEYFINNHLTDTTLWTYRDPNGGFCVAMRRSDPNVAGKQPQIGTICTDAFQKDACFFDNLIYDEAGKPRRLDDADSLATDYAKLIHPIDVSDKCVACHIGQNPFIGHPQKKLGRVLQGMYDGAPAPPEGLPPMFSFVDFGGDLPTWRNKPPLVRTGPEAACMRCHQLPQVSQNSRFCGSVLEMAAKNTMPPHSGVAGSVGWPDRKGCFPPEASHLQDYFASLRTLRAMCTGEKQASCLDE